MIPGLSQGLCQAQMEVRVFSVAQSGSNPEAGWGSLWAWVEVFVTRLRPVYDQGQGSSWDQEQGEAAFGPSQDRPTS